MIREPDWTGQLYVLTSLPRKVEVPPESLNPGFDGRGYVKYEDFLLLKSSRSERCDGFESWEFWILHRSGRVVASYGYEYSADAEYSCPKLYEMRGGTLFRFSGRSNDAWTAALTTWTAEVICEAWEKLQAEDALAVEFRRAWERLQQPRTS